MAVLGALGLVSLRGLVERCLLPDRPGDAHRPLGKKLDSDCRVCRAVAQQRVRSIAEAAIEAAELRLRPILMTSFAFILGVMPLVFATGAGALGRRSVGTTIVGGMLLSTVLNLIFHSRALRDS
jgi:HAE1 family hydrophobic/amphiphilic exporter-1